MNIISYIVNCCKAIKRSYESESDKYYDSLIANNKFMPQSVTTKDFLYIDDFPQDDPNAILKYGVPLMHYYDRDVKTIQNRCAKDKTLNLDDELQNLLDLYMFKQVEQNNDEHDRVGAYKRFLVGDR